MKVRRFCLLLGLAMSAAAQFATTAMAQSWHGTWSATGQGGSLAGTWTARAAGEPEEGVGTWTLLDPAGRTVAGGAWSARKKEDAWEGRWRAGMKNGVEFSGTWTARSALPGKSRFPDLIESALGAILNGTWRAGNSSGAWSIRASAADR